MKKLKKIIYITIAIIFVMIIILINVMANFDIKLNQNKTEENIILNNEIIEKSELRKKEIEDKEIVRLVKTYVNKYFNLLNAFYGEDNYYGDMYSTQQIKEMLYDISVKTNNENIDNFTNNFEIKENTKYHFDEYVYVIEDEENIIKYFYGFSAELKDYDNMPYFEAVIYVDKTTNTYAIFFGADGMDVWEVEYPEIETIEKNSNNEFEK